MPREPSQQIFSLEKVETLKPKLLMILSPKFKPGETLFIERRLVFNRLKEVTLASLGGGGTPPFSADVGQEGRSRGETHSRLAITTSNVKPFITGHPLCMANDFDPGSGCDRGKRRGSV